MECSVNVFQSCVLWRLDSSPFPVVPRGSSACGWRLGLLFASSVFESVLDPTLKSASFLDFVLVITHFSWFSFSFSG